MFEADEIIKKLSDVVNARCINEESTNALNNQIESITKLIEHSCIPENKIEDDLDAAECQICEFYKEYVSKWINVYEVYHHNFPETISDMIGEVAINLFEARDNVNPYNDRKFLFQTTQKRLFVLYYAIGIEIIKDYFQQYKFLMKNIKRFNYKNVNTNNNLGISNNTKIKNDADENNDTEITLNKTLQKELKETQKHLKSDFKKVQKKYDTFFYKRRKKNGARELCLENISSENNGEELVGILVDNLKKCIANMEQLCCNAVKHGYNPPFLFKTIRAVFYVVLPIALWLIKFLKQHNCTPL